MANDLVRVLAVLFATVALACGAARPAAPRDRAYHGPNGKIAFTRTTQPCTSPGFCTNRIWVADVNGGGLRRLTIGPQDWAPAWSPDSRRLAYVHLQGTGFSEPWLWVVNADGGGNKQVIQMSWSAVPNENAVSWSPNGKEVVYAELQTERKGSSVRAVRELIRSVDVNTRSVRTLFSLPPSANVYSPRFSPDGRRIGFVQQRGNRAAIVTARPDGSDVRQVTLISGGLLRTFDWSPDSRKIVFAPLGSSELQVEIVNADGSGRHHLTDKYGEKENPVFAPDGRTIVFENPSTGENNLRDRFAVVAVDGSGLRHVGPGSANCRVRDANEGMGPCRVRQPSWGSSRAAVSSHLVGQQTQTRLMWKLSSTLTPDWYFKPGVHPRGVAGGRGHFEATLALAPDGRQVLTWHVSYNHLCKEMQAWVLVRYAAGGGQVALLHADPEFVRAWYEHRAHCEQRGTARLSPSPESRIDAITGNRTWLELFATTAYPEGPLRGPLLATKVG
jgi:hypothetical protein